MSAPRCFPACAGSCCSPPLQWPVQAVLPGPVQQAPGSPSAGWALPFPAVQKQSRSLPRYFLPAVQPVPAVRPLKRSLPMPELPLRTAFCRGCRGQSVYSRTFFSCCAPNLMHFYRDAALRKKGSVSSSQYSFSIHPRASPRQLPHTAKRSSEKLPPRYQKMLQNRYVSARKNIAQSQKLQIFPAKSAFCLVVLTCVWYYT